MYEVQLHDPPILGDAFQRFADACRANPTDRGYFSYAEPQFEKLSNEVAFALPAYERAATGWDAQSQRHIRKIRAGRDLQGFLERTGAHASIHAGQFDSTKAATDFEREAARELCQLVQRFVIDGLELSSSELRFRRGRFVRLTDSTFGEITGGKPSSYDRCLGLYVMELHWRHPNPPWDTGVFDDAESTQDRVQRLAHPWIAFINLWERGKIRVAGVYESSDSGLLRSPRRHLEIGEPVWQDHYEHNAEKDVDEWASESPRRTVTIHDEARFVRFLERLDDGLQRAGAEAHRADIAMRYFRRVVENYWTHHIGGNGASQDHNEDIVVEAITALETILLANEKKGKADLMAARAAAILEDTDDGRRRVRKQIQRLYKLRSAILHGDARPSTTELTQAAVDAEECARRCVAAFLLSGGDRQAVLQASRDTATAAALRRRIML